MDFAAGRGVRRLPGLRSQSLTEVFQEVKVTDNSRTVPVQFMYSDAVHGPEGQVAKPEVLSQAAGQR